MVNKEQRKAIQYLKKHNIPIEEELIEYEIERARKRKEKMLTTIVETIIRLVVPTAVSILTAIAVVSIMR